MGLDQSKLAVAAAQWNPRATAPSPGLADARSSAHWAAQLVAAAGWTLAAPVPDDSQGSLEWIDARGALLGVAVERGGRTARAGLRLHDLTLLALGADAAPAAELPLAGQTLDAGLVWLVAALGSILGVEIPYLERPRHELPPNPVGDGALFGSPDAASFEELTAWFSSADRVLRAVAASTPEASPVRCWPHHFDVATSLHLDPPSSPGKTARTLGVGLSPGDGSYAEPYWYVTPWPTPSAEHAPPLPFGHWHIQGWFGAVLPATDFAVANKSTAAGARVADFLPAAISVCRQLLSAPGSTVTDR